MIRRLLAALLLALVCAGAAAQALNRPIPADAKRGTIRHLQEMVVEINGQAMQLSAGAQIRDASNLIVLPSALPPGALAKYTLSPQGQVQRVWILTAEEAAAPDPKK